MGYNLGLEFGERTCPKRARLLSLWQRRRRALPAMTTGRRPIRNLAVQWSTSVTDTPYAEGARACKHPLRYGNFHMKPNGIFFVSGDKAAVAETGAFLKQRPRTDLATQSGPMLVINGRVHPRFDKRSTSLKARNGVGVRTDGRVLFAISEGEVSFDAFARLFRDGLKCPNALFLDGGSASNLYAPTLNRLGNFVSLGPMLAVFERNRGQVGERLQQNLGHPL
jgi:hypothetical protein